MYHPFKMTFQTINNWFSSLVYLFTFSSEPITNRLLPKKLPEKTNEKGFLPIKNHEIYKLYESQRDSFWVPSDVSLTVDIDQMDTLSPEKYELVVGLLAFFVPTDDAVNDNLMTNFQEELSTFYKESGYFYTMQAAIETVHSELYSEFADTLIKNPDDRKRIFESTTNYKSIEKLFSTMNKYMNKDKPLPIRLLFFACVEGILFNTVFVIVYWFKRQNLLPGFTKGNEFIARDEALHTRKAITALLCLDRDGYFDLPTFEESKALIDECIEINDMFNKEILPEAIISLSSDELSQYTRCTADVMLESLGYEKHYNAINPFTWMAVISLPNKSNFFETKTSEYAKSKSKRVFSSGGEY